MAILPTLVELQASNDTHLTSVLTTKYVPGDLLRPWRYYSKQKTVFLF